MSVDIDEMDQISPDPHILEITHNGIRHRQHSTSVTARKPYYAVF